MNTDPGPATTEENEDMADKIPEIEICTDGVKVFLLSTDKERLSPILLMGGKLYTAETASLFDLSQDLRDKILCAMLGLAPTGVPKEESK